MLNINRTYRTPRICPAKNLHVSPKGELDGLINAVDFFPQVFDLCPFLLGFLLLLFRGKTRFGCFAGFWSDECPFQQGLHFFHYFLLIVQLGSVSLRFDLKKTFIVYFGAKFLFKLVFLVFGKQ